MQERAYVYLNSVFTFSAATTKYKTDGQLTVLKDPSGRMGTEKDSISFKLAKRREKDSLRKGMILHVLGELAQLGKNTVFYIREWEIIRQSSIRKMFAKTAVNGEHLRDGDSAGQVIGIKGTVCELPDIYTQDVRDVHELLRQAGFKESPETAWLLVDYFWRRAKQQGYEGVADLLATNPYIIAETEEFTLAEAKRMAKNLNVKLPIEMEAMAVIAQAIARSTRKGNTYIPATHVAVQTKNDKVMMELAKNATESNTILINRLLISSARDVSKQGGAKVTISGKKDCGEEAASYYTQKAEALGENFAEKSYYYGAAAATGIYMTSAYFAERSAADLFVARLGVSENGYPLGMPKGIPLSSEQEQAIQNAIAYKTSVVVGQAGTGKTHIIKALDAYCRERGKQITVIAPSAMAASVAGGKAQLSKNSFFTIHRFANITHMSEDLGSSDFLPQDGENGMENLFHHTDFLVVDEMSLCSITVFCRLLHAIKNQPQLHLIIMGDPGQLLAIGPSGFFHQMAARIIDPSFLPVTELKTVFRTEGEDLLEMALQVRNNHTFTVKSTDAVQLIGRDKEALFREVSALLQDGVSFEKILILSDQRKDEMGTIQLNAFLRSKLNEKGKRINETAGSFAVGDPVVAMQNDYAEYAPGTTGRRKSAFVRHEGRTQDVFNGMRGTIVEQTGGGIMVRWNDPEHEVSPYTFEEISYWIEPAYATTVHKAQGSEADYVFFVPASDGFSRINQNMMYTAITRAQKKVYLMGDESLWTMAAGKIQMHPYTKFGFLVNQAIEETKWKNRKTKDASANRFKVVMDF